MENVRRFLRADRGNLKKATIRLTDTLKWRREVRPETKMCGACLNKDLRAHYMQHCGWDRRGRALVFSDIGLARDKNPSTNAEHCMQVLELLEPSLAPFPDDQYIWVVDFHKFSVSDMNPAVAGACLKLFGRSYPERLGGMIMVGAPPLFNGLWRVVSGFADPVTVKKVRFVKGPDGRGGGKSLGPVLDEFFDEETAAWLVDEMTENRKRWKDLATRKSWVAATTVGNGTRHGWWEDESSSSGANNRKKNNINSSNNVGKHDQKNGNGNGNNGGVCVPMHSVFAGGVGSETGHDVRGCPSFLRSKACERMCKRARNHAPEGKLTKGVVLEVAMAAAAAEAAATDKAPAASDVSADEDEFFDAHEHCS